MNEVEVGVEIEEGELVRLTSTTEDLTELLVVPLLVFRVNKEDEPPPLPPPLLLLPFPPIPLQVASVISIEVEPFVVNETRGGGGGGGSDKC